MPQVSRDQDWSGLGQLQGQNLVAGSMPRSGFDDDGSIAEDIVVGVGEDHRLAGAEPIVSRIVLGTGSEHGIPFRCMDQPRGPGERVRIRRVIEMIMRKGNVGDVLRRIAKRCQLRQQRLRGTYRIAFDWVTCLSPLNALSGITPTSHIRVPLG